MSSEGRSSAMEWHREAVTLVGRGRYSEAFDSLRGLVQRHPDFQLAYNDLGVLSFRLGLSNEARRFLERAVELDPHHAPSRENLAAFVRTTEQVRFRAPRLRVDFVAYHDLQAQAGASIFDALAPHFDCQWRIGPHQQPTGAEVAVMLDHFGFQRHLTKAPDGYRHIVHVSHDFTDLMIYFKEEKFLRQCDLILTPGLVHQEVARRALGPAAEVRTIGWPKFDRLAIAPEYAALGTRLRALPQQLTLLYAPTLAWTFEWIDLLPRLQALPVNVIVKNHIYVNPGQPLPPGSEEKYRAGLVSAEAMETYVESLALPHWMVAPRPMNSCSLFPFCDVAISDTSSILAEFMHFGLGIETGRVDLDPTNLRPEVSKHWKNVLFFPTPELHRVLGSAGELERLYAARGTTGHEDDLAELQGAGARAAQAIDDYLTAAYRPLRRAAGGV